jgi:hypothetical protein
MAATQIVFELRAVREVPGLETRRKTRLALGYFSSVLLYFVLIWIFGFGIATALFTLGFLYGWLRMHFFHALIYTGSLVSVMIFMGWLLGLYWPEGLLLGL